MMLFIVWYVQDLIQVALTSSLMAPEIFLVVLNFYSIRREEEDPRWALIAAAGGLAFDLRWTGLLGLSGALYCLGSLALRLFWFQLPRLGRSPGVFLLANLLLCAVISGIRLLFWSQSVLADRVFSVFFLQMVLTVPVLLVLWLMQVLSDDES